MKSVKTFEEYLNESSVKWKEKRGVIEFTIQDTLYSLYHSITNKTWELYKYDDDHGPMIMKFKIEEGRMVLLQGMFDLDFYSRTYSDEIIEAICSYFKVDSKKIIYNN